MAVCVVYLLFVTDVYAAGMVAILQVASAWITDPRMF